MLLFSFRFFFSFPLNICCRYSHGRRPGPTDDAGARTHPNPLEPVSLLFTKFESSRLSCLVLLPVRLPRLVVFLALLFRERSRE